MTNVHQDLTFQSWVFLIGGEPNNCSAMINKFYLDGWMDGNMNVKQFPFRFWEHISDLLKRYFYCWYFVLFRSGKHEGKEI